MKSTWIEIKKDALWHNIEQIKKRFSKTIKCNVVVKANAYGHGLLKVARAVQDKVDYFSVYDFDDAVILRDNGITNPILVLGRVFPEQIDIAVAKDIEVTVTTFDMLECGDARLKMHICVDTGMGRDGFVEGNRDRVLQLLGEKNCNVKGLYMHFASADESAFDDYTKKQINGLLDWQQSLQEIGLNPMLHKGASCSAFLDDDGAFDMVRLGISLYGLWPSQELKARYSHQVNLQPALSWKVRIVEVKSLPKGSAISYGCSHILPRDSKIALLPVGYFDGISRVSSNLGSVVVNGKKVPQIGKVTMNITVIDVTDVEDVEVGDVATVIGQEVSADDWAGWSNTSNYEIVTRVNAGIERRVS